MRRSKRLTELRIFLSRSSGVHVAGKISAVPGASLEEVTPDVPLAHFAVQLATRPFALAASRQAEAGSKTLPAGKSSRVVPFGFNTMETAVFIPATKPSTRTAL